MLEMMVKKFLICDNVQELIVMNPNGILRLDVFAIVHMKMHWKSLVNCMENSDLHRVLAG